MNRDKKPPADEYRGRKFANTIASMAFIRADAKANHPTRWRSWPTGPLPKEKYAKPSPTTERR